MGLTTRKVTRVLVRRGPEPITLPPRFASGRVAASPGRAPLHQRNRRPSPPTAKRGGHPPAREARREGEDVSAKRGWNQTAVAKPDVNPNLLAVQLRPPGSAVGQSRRCPAQYGRLRYPVDLLLSVKMLLSDLIQPRNLPMSLPRRNALLSLAIVAGLLSLPTTWLKFTKTKFTITPNFGGRILNQDSDFKSMLAQKVTKTSLSLTGLNGSVSLILDIPIWLIATLAIMSNILILADAHAGIDFPRAVLWAFSIAATCLATLPALIAIAVENVTPGIGWAFGLVAAIVPLSVLWVVSRPELIDDKQVMMIDSVKSQPDA